MEQLIVLAMSKKVYQVKISLKGISPAIWRRILVVPDISLVDFHRIIQTTMGWSNSHLHLFKNGREEYSPKEFEVEDNKDSRVFKLNKLLKREKNRILYEYDFGDGWEHIILLEKIVEVDEKEQVPKCLKGKRNCPPEDCGGIWGYNDFLKIISNPQHEEYEETMEWCGEEFDPEYFNIQEINELLSQRNYGCIWIE